MPEDDASHLGCSNFPLAFVPCLGALVAEGTVRLEFVFFARNLAGSFMHVSIWKRQRHARRLGGEIIALPT